MPSTASPLGTVLVIGGCGFVGSNVVDQLLNFPSESIPRLRSSHTSRSATKSSTDVVIHSDHEFPSLRSRYPSYDRTETRVHALDLKCVRNRFDGCTYHDCDITSEEELQRVFEEVKPDVVINTASPHFDAPKAILRKVNIDGTRTLLEVAKSRCKIFVHTSSSSVVHDAESDLRSATEAYPYVCPNPREYYSETKVLAERLVLEANAPESGFLTCAVRPAGIIGEGDKSGFGYSMTHQAKSAPSWQLKLQLGDNSNLFDCTYAGNVVYGLLCAAQALMATLQRHNEGKSLPLSHERVDGEAFNVTNGEPAYFWDLGRFIWARYGRTDFDEKGLWAVPKEWAVSIGRAAELFSGLTGRKGRFTAQSAKYACMSRYFSCEKLKVRTGYRAVVGLEEGLERTVRWFKEEEEREEADGGVEKKVP